MASISTWASPSGRIPGWSLKYLNFWHLVLEVKLASKYCSEYSEGWRTLGKYYAVFWKTRYNDKGGHNRRIRSRVCAGQTVVPLMKHIVVVSFFSFKCLYGHRLSFLIEMSLALTFHLTVVLFILSGKQKYLLELQVI